MDASEFNEKLNTLLQGSLLNVATGKMSPAAAVGILELHRAEFIDRIRILTQQQAAAKSPRIVLPQS